MGAGLICWKQQETKQGNTGEYGREPFPASTGKAKGNAAGEKIDIINWDDNPAYLIENALSPAKVICVVADEEAREAQVIVPDYQLSLAIGKEGQNARLAAKLTGYKIDIKSETQARELGLFEEMGLEPGMEEGSCEGYQEDYEAGYDGYEEQSDNNQNNYQDGYEDYQGEE